MGQDLPGKREGCVRYVVLLLGCNKCCCPGWKSCCRGIWEEGSTWAQLWGVMEVMQGRMDCHLIEMCVPEKSQGNTSQNEVDFHSQIKVLLPTKSCLPPSAECRQPDLRNGQGDPNETTNSLSRAQASSLSAGSQHIPNLSLITIAMLSRWK